MRVFLSMCFLLYAVEAYTFANKTKLHKDLFTNYEKEFRAGENQTIPTEITFSFNMKSLKEFQGSNGVIGVVGSLGVEWKDGRLVWNPLDYGGDLNQTSVFVEKIWSPYIAVTNPYEKITPILSGGFSCKLWYNGNVSCIPPPNIFEALCNANIFYYPYDTKNCSFQLYVSENVSPDLKLKPGSFNRNTYIDYGQWKITSTRIFVHIQHDDNTSFEILKLETGMKRRPGTYMWQLSPIFILSVLQIFVFVLPNESGETVSYLITILLAEIVFLTFTHESLPNVSKSPIPVLFYKQFTDILISFWILIGVIHTSYIYNKTKNKKTKEKEETPVESVVQRICTEIIIVLRHPNGYWFLCGLIAILLNNFTCYFYVAYHS